ncbi:hypothetical protein [Vogesella sp. XCS3]|uniref:hypothetical protein n=1 Tax=Vogesella sp. XCS3 TaxID=2877939 RepID=UPI001B4D4EAE|nr:hypothetical protein [Vogesella sp. XCS3]MBP7581563.1 hypothetical protein [Vogesella sp.]UDM16138.1 hypothetical protein LCH97_12665 [Vogesella sp. XCS3]
MASLFILSRHLARDVLADELPPPHHHSLWHTLCSQACSLVQPSHRPALPDSHQHYVQRWLMEKGPHRC